MVEAYLVEAKEHKAIQDKEVYLGQHSLEHKAIKDQVCLDKHSLVHKAIKRLEKKFLSFLKMTLTHSFSQLIIAESLNQSKQSKINV